MKTNKQRVAVGMSGGVDSSAAAARLLELGYDVIGITMRLWDGEENSDGSFTESACCSLSAVEDARRVCYTLGIEHYVMDFREEFEKHVINYFANEYLHGRTPNPCIACNKFLKFDALMKKAQLLDAHIIATGHYAKIEEDKKSGRYLLKRANADRKDQTYALCTMSQYQLSHTLMPLGEFESKEAVREYAKQLGLPTALKSDSQEICFVPDGAYAEFIERYTGKTSDIGDFVDESGNFLGKHKGIINYTVGQRKGLGAFGRPMFVVGIDPQRKEVILGEKGSEFSSTLKADGLNFIPFDVLEGKLKVLAKVRYSAPLSAAEAFMCRDGIMQVNFEKPQRAITPGQMVVLYDEREETVIGGGTIL